MTIEQRALFDLLSELIERTMQHLDDVTSFGWLDRIEHAQVLLSDLLSLVTNAQECNLVIDAGTLAGEIVSLALAAHREAQQHPWNPSFVVYR